MWLNRFSAAITVFEYDLLDGDSCRLDIFFALLKSLLVAKDDGLRTVTDLDFVVRLRYVRWDAPSIKEVFRCIFYKTLRKNN